MVNHDLLKSRVVPVILVDARDFKGVHIGQGRAVQGRQIGKFTGQQKELVGQTQQRDTFAKPVQGGIGGIAVVSNLTTGIRAFLLGT